jgi:hypothetical protein
LVFVNGLEIGATIYFLGIVFFATLQYLVTAAKNINRKRLTHFTSISSSGGKATTSHLSIYNKDLISILPEQEF